MNIDSNQEFAALSNNPIDVVEQIAALNEWAYDRIGEQEISISFTGEHSSYHLSFSWLEELNGLHLVCGLESKIALRKKADIVELLAKINEQLWLGHFDYWAGEQIVMFRHTQILSETAEITQSIVQKLMTHAVEQCDKYYPAFQYVLWAGQTANDAFEAAKMETQGNA